MVAVDEVGVGVVVQGNDDLRVLSLFVLGVVFDVAAAGLVERELAVTVLVVLVVVDDGGDVLGCGRGRCNRRLILRRLKLRGGPLVHLKM